MLVAAGGLALLFIAGLKWRIIVPPLAGAVVAAPIVYFRFLHDYQRSRIDVLLDRSPIRSAPATRPSSR